MAMVCDACGTKFVQNNSGHSTLNVTPPRIDFKMIQALMNAGKPFEHCEHASHDICLACTRKVLGLLGLPTDVCELPEMPTETTTADPSEKPLAGALTPAELKALGIEPNTT
jgi:hypothetical protein